GERLRHPNQKCDGTRFAPPQKTLLWLADFQTFRVEDEVEASPGWGWYVKCGDILPLSAGVRFFSSGFYLRFGLVLFVRKDLHKEARPALCAPRGEGADVDEALRCEQRWIEGRDNG